MNLGALGHAGEAVEELIRVLDEQAALYETLLDLSRRKRELLVQGGAAEFEALVDQEQAVLWQAARLEERRFGLQTNLAGTLGRDAAELNVTELLSLTQKPQTSRLSQLQQRISDTLGELGRVNEQNSLLIRKSLSYIEAALNRMTRDNAAPVYAPDGRINQPRQTRPTINREL